MYSGNNPWSSTVHSAGRPCMFHLQHKAPHCSNCCILRSILGNWSSSKLLYNTPLHSINCCCFYKVMLLPAFSLNNNGLQDFYTLQYHLCCRNILFNFSIVAVSYKAELLSVIVESPNYQSSVVRSNYQLSHISTPSHLLICRK